MPCARRPSSTTNDILVSEAPWAQNLDIDAVTAQSVEEATGHTGLMTHVFAHNCYGGKVALHLDRIELASLGSAANSVSRAAMALSASELRTAKEVVFSLEA